MKNRQGGIFRVEDGKDLVEGWTWRRRAGVAETA